MHVLIDAVNIPVGKTGGGETYFWEFLGALSTLNDPNQYSIITRRPNREVLARWQNNGFQYLYVDGFKRVRLRRMIRHTLSYFPPMSSLLNADFDVMHWTNGVIFPQPISPTIPCVVTLMDIQHIYWPQFFDKATLRRREKLFSMSMERSQAIITISEFTRDSIIEHYRADPAKITTIYHGVNHERFIPREQIPPHCQEALRAKYRLPENYLIYPAGTWQHKNHQRLLEALHLLKEQGVKLNLILTGIMRDQHSQVLGQIEALGLSEQVRHLGLVDWDELPHLVAMATGMIFPSLFEGFGMPIIEAMSAGCPVACANTTALSEIGGTAVYHFDPTDPAAIAEAMVQIWSDPALRQELIAKGHHHCQQFTWQDNVRRTVDVYKSVARR